MNLDEAQLYRAAVLADHMEMASWPGEETCPKHAFSKQFEKDMQILLAKLEHNEIKPYRVFPGWSYYVGRGIAAIVLCFLLACLTMPDTVQAGYEKLIEVVKHVVTEYTEYRYHSSVPGDAEFVPLEIGYLPEGLQLTEEYKDENEIYVLYRDGRKYFILRQIVVTENDQFQFAVDTEDARMERKILHGVQLDLIYKEDVITYIWLYGQYHVSGKCNLGINELEKILNSLVVY